MRLDESNQSHGRELVWRRASPTALPSNHRRQPCPDQTDRARFGRGDDVFPVREKISARKAVRGRNVIERQHELLRRNVQVEEGPIRKLPLDWRGQLGLIDCRSIPNEKAPVSAGAFLTSDFDVLTEAGRSRPADPWGPSSPETPRSGLPAGCGSRPPGSRRSARKHPHRSGG